jgi:hypothetical protein
MRITNPGRLMTFEPSPSVAATAEVGEYAAMLGS